MQVEIQKLSAKNEMLTRTTEQLLSKMNGKERSGGKTTDRLAESVEPEYVGLVMNVGQKFSGWTVAEFSILEYWSDVPLQTFR